MGLAIKCNLYVSPEQIMVVDSTGFYDAANNPTGWGLPSSGINDQVSLNGDTRIVSITLVINGVSISISAGTNESLLETKYFPALLSPNDLVVIINPTTYSDYYTDFGNMVDGEITVSYTIVTTSDIYNFTTSFFNYKNVEEKVWDLFLELAEENKTLTKDNQKVNKALYAYSILKGLEYSARTSISNTKSGEILNTLSKVLDYQNSKSC